MVRGGSPDWIGYGVLGGWILALLFCVGWLINIYKLVGLIGGDITTWFIARLVGIFVLPLGGILGYF